MNKKYRYINFCIKKYWSNNIPNKTIKLIFIDIKNYINKLI